MWRIWIIGCCRDKSTRRVYFAINGLMSVSMYTWSTHIVVEDAAVGRVILGGQQVDGEECRHSPRAWSGWHQSLISISKIIRKRRLTLEYFTHRITTVGEARVVSAVTSVNYAVKCLRSFQSDLKNEISWFMLNLARKFKIYTDVVFMSVKISGKQLSQVVYFLRNGWWESWTNQRKK